MTKPETVEQEIQRKGLTAPRVTPERIAEVVKRAEFHVFPGSCLTVCCLTLANGFTVTGYSACASPANFDGPLGERIARENAMQQIWALEGYLLRQKLADEPKDAKARAELERAQLAARIDGLESFFGKPAYAALSDNQRMRLSAQGQYMHGYLEALDARLRDWE